MKYTGLSGSGIRQKEWLDLARQEEKHNFKRIIQAYRDLLGILFPEAPFMVISVFVAAIAVEYHFNIY